MPMTVVLHVDQDTLRMRNTHLTPAQAAQRIAAAVKR